MRPPTADGLHPTAAPPASTARDSSSNSMMRDRGVAGFRASRRDSAGAGLGAGAGVALAAAAGAAAAAAGFGVGSASRRSARRPARVRPPAPLCSPPPSDLAARRGPPPLRPSGSMAPQAWHTAAAALAGVEHPRQVPSTAVSSRPSPERTTGTPSASIASTAPDGCTASARIRWPSRRSSRTGRPIVWARRVHRAMMAAWTASLSVAAIASVVEFHDSSPLPLPSRLAVMRGHVGTAMPGPGAPRVRLLAIRSSPRGRRGRRADRRGCRRRPPRSADGSRSTGRLCP